MGEQVVEERVEGKHVTVLLLDPERLTGEPIFEANRPHGAQAEADGGAGPRAPVLVVVLMWGFLLFAVPVHIHPAVNHGQAEQRHEPRYHCGEGLGESQVLAPHLHVPPASVQLQVATSFLDVFQQSIY